MLPMYPYLTTIVVLSLFSLREKLAKTKYKILIALLVLISFVFPLFKHFPYYFTYTNPIFGKPDFVHENLVAQKPFGVGAYELKEFLLEKYVKDIPQFLCLILSLSFGFMTRINSNTLKLMVQATTNYWFWE